MHIRVSKKFISIEHRTRTHVSVFPITVYGNHEAKTGLSQQWERNCRRQNPAPASSHRASQVAPEDDPVAPVGAPTFGECRRPVAVQIADDGPWHRPSFETVIGEPSSSRITSNHSIDDDHHSLVYLLSKKNDPVHQMNQHKQWHTNLRQPRFSETLK